MNNEISLEEFRRDIRRQMREKQMTDEIPLSEFLEDIRRQKLEKRKVERRKIEKPVRKPRKIHWEALSKSEYNSKTDNGRYSLDRPRPVWLDDSERWTVGAPVNPAEWQILVRSEPASRRVTRIDVEQVIMRICGWFRMHDNTFSRCVSNLQRRRLLKSNGGFTRTRIVEGWLFPALTGQRAGGEWHRNRVLDFIDWVSREFGCYTYADRGYCPSLSMPDVITVRPQLISRSGDRDLHREPLRWDIENPIYTEFKSARDMRRNPARLEEQLDKYEGVPLYLGVEARVSEARKMLEYHGRREVNLLDLLREAKDDMVYLIGSEKPEAESSFDRVLEKIREAMLEAYDRKARLKKTGMDPQGRERHSLILYDKENTPKNIGQVIPTYAEDIEEFAELYFDKRKLGRIATTDYIYTPERKPTYKNKTWRWERRKTRGLKFRSFPA